MRRATSSHRERAQTRGVHALSTVLLRATQDAEHGAITHLGPRISIEGAAHDFEHVWPEFLCPAEHALWRAISVVLVGFRAVLGIGHDCVFASVASAMRCDANALVKAFHDGCRCSHLDPLLPKQEGHAVEAVVNSTW